MSLSRSLVKRSPPSLGSWPPACHSGLRYHAIALACSRTSRPRCVSRKRPHRSPADDRDASFAAPLGCVARGWCVGCLAPAAAFDRPRRSSPGRRSVAPGAYVAALYLHAAPGSRRAPVLAAYSRGAGPPSRRPRVGVPSRRRLGGLCSSAPLGFAPVPHPADG